MGLMDQIRVDVQTILTNGNDFAVDIVMIAPNAAMAAFKGLHSKHHFAVDLEGNQVNSKNSHITFSEQTLVDLGYPLRNLSGEVDLYRHRVNVKDSTGIVKNYIVGTWFPDETVGLITCILQDYE
jgi:hypothetical protein